MEREKIPACGVRLARPSAEQDGSLTGSSWCVPGGEQGQLVGGRAVYEVYKEPPNPITLGAEGTDFHTSSLPQ